MSPRRLLLLLITALSTSCDAPTLETIFASYPNDAQQCADSSDCDDSQLVCSPDGFCEPPAEHSCMAYDNLVDVGSSRGVPLEDHPDSRQGQDQSTCNGQVATADNWTSSACDGLRADYVNSARNYVRSARNDARQELQGLLDLYNRNDRNDLRRLNDQLYSAMAARLVNADIHTELSQFLDGADSVAASTSESETVQELIVRRRAEIQRDFPELTPQTLRSSAQVSAAGETIPAGPRPAALSAADGITLTLEDCVATLDSHYDLLAAGQTPDNMIWGHFCLSETFPQLFDLIESRIRAGDIKEFDHEGKRVFPSIASLRDAAAKSFEYYRLDSSWEPDCATYARIRELPSRLLAETRGLVSAAATWQYLFPVLDATVTYPRPVEGTLCNEWISNEPFYYSVIRVYLRMHGQPDSYCPGMSEDNVWASWRRSLSTHETGGTGAFQFVDSALAILEADLNDNSKWSADRWPDAARIVTYSKTFLPEQRHLADAHAAAQAKLAAQEQRAFWVGLGLGIGCGAATTVATVWSGPGAVIAGLGGAVLCSADFVHQLQGFDEINRLARHTLTMRQFGVSTSLIPTSATDDFNRRRAVAAGSFILATAGALGDASEIARALTQVRRFKVLRNYYRVIGSLYESPVGNLGRTVRNGMLPRNINEELFSELRVGRFVDQPSSPYHGNWDGHGCHTWSCFERMRQRSDIQVEQIDGPDASGITRWRVKRWNRDANNGAGSWVELRKKKDLGHSVFPPEMSDMEMAHLGDLAYRIAGEVHGIFPRPKSADWIDWGNSSRQTLYEPSKRYFEAEVETWAGKRLKIAGFVDQHPDGNLTTFYPLHDSGVVFEDARNWSIGAKGLSFVDTARQADGLTRLLLSAIEGLGPRDVLAEQCYEGMSCVAQGDRFLISVPSLGRMVSPGSLEAIHTALLERGGYQSGGFSIEFNGPPDCSGGGPCAAATEAYDDITVHLGSQAEQMKSHELRQQVGCIYQAFEGREIPGGSSYDCRPLCERVECEQIFLPLVMR